MYFVHPQMRLNGKNLAKIFSSFSKNRYSMETEKFRSLFPGKRVFFTDMGRTAFKLIIEELGLQNSEMIFPAYICDIFYPILKKYNITPIFLDASKTTFSTDYSGIQSKITPGAKAVLVCHTFGLVNPPETIENLRGKYNLKIIEDCAHAFSGVNESGLAGSFGDAALFSFYKQFPTVRGGCTVLNEISRTEKKVLLNTHFSVRDFLSLLNNFPFFAYLFKSWGNELAPKIQRAEKTDKISKINDISLNLFLNFSEGFDKYLPKRVELALYFQQKLKELGFTVQEPQNNVFCFLSALAPENMDRDGLVKKLRKYGVFATRIWHTPLILNPEAAKDFNVNPAEFPNALEISRRIINFPLQNHYIQKDIDKMVSAIKKCLD